MYKILKTERTVLLYLWSCLVCLYTTTSIGQNADVYIIPGSVIQSFEDENVKAVINFGQTPAAILEDNNVQLAINFPNLLIEDATTSSDEYEKIKGMKVFPNPFATTILLRRESDFHEKYNVSILNQTGVLLSRQYWETNSPELVINFSTFSPVFI